MDADDNRSEPTRSSFSDFLGELKRRHVGRVAVAYAAVVFVVLQAGEIVLAAFLNPFQADAALRVLVVAFALLFPVVLVLAWVYEITPQGIRSMAELDAAAGRETSGRLAPRIALLGVTVLAAGAAGLWWVKVDDGATPTRPERTRASPPAFVAATTTDTSGPIRSLAVLPLQDFSPDATSDPEAGYFAASMHEALVSRLGQNSSARVISRTSVLEYERVGKSVPQIGQELGVDAVVEGSVLRADGRVRITVQLIHAASDTHLWVRDYERDLADVIALQAEVANEIAQEIEVRLAGAAAGSSDGPDRVAQETPLASSAPPDAPKLEPESAPSADAQDALLRGRFALSQVGPGSSPRVEAAPAHFERALDADSTFAPALAGRVGALLVHGLAGEEPTVGELYEARRLARYALQLDSTSLEAADVLAGIDQALAAVPDSNMRPVWSELGGLLQSALARRDTRADDPASVLRGIRRLEIAGRFDEADVRAR